MYLDGVSNKDSTVNVDQNVDWTQPDWGIGGRAASGANKFTGDIADLIIDDTYIDLSSSSNREKFILANSPVDPGSDASTAMGASPLIYLNSNTLSTWHTNSGTGGGFTENGALTAGSTVTKAIGNNFAKTGTITSTSDSPTNDSANGYGNYATWDALNNNLISTSRDHALSNGNRTTTLGGSTSSRSALTIHPSHNVHVEFIAGAVSGLYPFIQGFVTGGERGGSSIFQNSADGENTVGLVDGASAAEWSAGQRVTIEVDTINGRVYFWVNGTAQNSANPDAGSGYTLEYTPTGDGHISICTVCNGSATMTVNADNPADTVNTGYVTLSTANLPTPAVINYEDEYYIEAGISHSNGSTTAVTLPKTVSGGAMTRIKRTDSTGDWYVFDTVRGANKFFKWNSSAVEDTSTFDDQNLTGTTLTLPSDLASGTYLVEVFYVGSYFQIKTYTGTGSAHAENFPGTLDTAPGFMAFANRTTSRDMKAYHISTTATAAMNLQETTASSTNSIWFNNTEPTTTQFTVGTYAGVNTNTDNQVMYAWATLMLKRTSATENWVVLSETLSGYNPTNDVLYPNLTQAVNANSTSTLVDLLSNGVKVRGTNTNINNGTYIYGAFGIQPMTNGSVDQSRAR